MPESANHAGKEVDFMTPAHLFLLFCTAVLFTAALSMATISDLKARTVPNLAPLLLLAAGVLNLFATGFSVHRLISVLLGAAIGGFPLLMMALFRGSIGGGDVKLAASAGFVLGWLPSYLALMAALFAFVLYGCFIQPKKDEEKAPSLPFAPFYAVAAFGAFVLPIIPHLSFIHPPII